MNSKNRLIKFEDYFKTPSFSFSCIGLNPYFECKRPTTNIRKWINFVHFHLCFWLLFICTVCELIFAATVAGDKERLLDFCRALSCALFDIMGIELLLLMWISGFKFNEFILQLEDLFPNDYETQDKYFIFKHYKETQMVLQNLTNVFVICIFIWVVGSPCYDVLISYIDDTPYVFELPFKMWSPIRLDTPISFYVALFMQFDTIYASVLAILAVNTFFVSIVGLISLQFNMLAQNIREIPPNDQSRAIQLTRVHNRLIEISKQFSQLISRTEFVNHILSSIALCCALFQVVSSEPSEIFRFLIFIICVLIQTFTMSYIGDVLIQHVRNIYDLCCN